MSTLEKVKKIIVDLLCINENLITPETIFKENLGADSLDLIEIARALEVEFNLTVSDEDLKQIQTVQDVIDYIESHT